MTVATALHQASSEREFVTFYLGELLLGVDIRQVQEINRQLEITAVPHAPQFVARCDQSARRSGDDGRSPLGA